MTFPVSIWLNRMEVRKLRTLAGATTGSSKKHNVKRMRIYTVRMYLARAHERLEIQIGNLVTNALVPKERLAFNEIRWPKL